MERSLEKGTYKKILIKEFYIIMVLKKQCSRLSKYIAAKNSWNDYFKRLTIIY